jgi:catechol 2,3-dioxygenase-like lactoylglutathione lyase family enzyme
MEQRLTIITLGVSNIDVAADFYENKLGWKRQGNSMGDIVFFQLNGIQLALYPVKELAKDATVPANGEGFKGFTLAQNVRSEKEVDELISTLKSKGVKVVKEPEKAFWGCYSSYIQDPEGNLWEIAYNPHLKLDAAGSVIG